MAPKPLGRPSRTGSLGAPPPRSRPRPRPCPRRVLTCSVPTAELQQKDQALVELLQEKVGLFAEMTHFQVEEDGGGLTLPALPRGLFRSESLECPRGERLLQDAIREGEGTLREESRPIHSASQNRDTWLDVDTHSLSVQKLPGAPGGGKAGEEAWCLLLFDPVSCLRLCCAFGALQ